MPYQIVLNRILRLFSAYQTVLTQLPVIGNYGCLLMWLVFQMMKLIGQPTYCVEIPFLKNSEYNVLYKKII